MGTGNERGGTWSVRRSWTRRVLSPTPPPPCAPPPTMHLMYYLDAEGKRVYTLKKATPEGAATVSAHPGT